MYQIEITDRQSQLSLDLIPLKQIAETLFIAEQVKSANVSLVFVENDEIHQINRDYLQHDYPTDVISFLLKERQSIDSGESQGFPRGRDQIIEGEVIVSTETAAHESKNYDWSSTEETVLYTIHGLLHLAGYDDLSDSERTIMRRREQDILKLCGMEPPQPDMDEPPGESDPLEQPSQKESHRS